MAAALKGAGSSASSDYDLMPLAGPGAARSLREAGVLVALWPDPHGAVRLVLTRRSPALRHHPGQIALPGGKVEACDDGPVAAALREAAEEVALPTASARLLGTLPAHRTVTGFRITPVVGWIDGPFRPHPEAGEVAEVFTVPFAHIVEPANYTVVSRRWRGGDRRYWVVPWGPYYIWGATARILRGLAERVAHG